MRRVLALAAAFSLIAGVATAMSHGEGEEGSEMKKIPEYQLDLSFVCGSAIDAQKHYADNLITWLQNRCQDGFIEDDVCKEINHYVDAYSGQVDEQTQQCRERIEEKESDM